VKDKKKAAAPGGVRGIGKSKHRHSTASPSVAQQDLTPTPDPFLPLVEKIGLCLDELNRRGARFSALDMGSLDILVRQYNAHVDLQAAGVGRDEFHIHQTAWGFQFEDGRFIRMLVVPSSAAPAKLQNPLEPVRIEDVSCGFLITMPEKGAHRGGE
jgi:hypothetical protein